MIKSIFVWDGWGAFGSLLSFVGLIVSSMAFYKAKGAKEAAEAARKGIDNIDAASEISVCKRKLNEARLSVEHKNWSMASHLVQDVCENLSSLAAAERLVLDEIERNTLAAEVEVLKRLGISLDRAMANGTASSQKMAEVLRSSSIKLAEMHRKVRDNV